MACVSMFNPSISVHRTLTPYIWKTSILPSAPKSAFSPDERSPISWLPFCKGECAEATCFIAKNQVTVVRYVNCHRVALSCWPPRPLPRDLAAVSSMCPPRGSVLGEGNGGEAADFGRHHTQLPARFGVLQSQLA